MASQKFLNRSIAKASNVVDTLAAFGLAYVIIKFFVGVLEEVKQVGVVLVHDRPGFHKILACVVAMGTVVLILSVVIGELRGQFSCCHFIVMTCSCLVCCCTAKTHLGVWLFEDLHGVSCSVGRLTHSTLLYLSAYPLIHAIVSYQ